MKKYYLVIISILITVLSFGQNTETDTIPENKKTSKIRLAPFFSYDFNLSNNIYNKDYGITNFKYEKFNFRAGIEISYFINKEISISTGVNYSNKDYSSSYDCDACDTPFFSDIKLRFTELPIFGSYHFNYNNFNFFGQIGVVNHFTTKRKIYFSDQEILLDNIYKYYLSGKFGLGVSYPVFKRHHLFIASDYILGITDIYKYKNYKLKTLGIRLGIEFLI